jgi:hypothetical protein
MSHKKEGTMKKLILAIAVLVLIMGFSAVSYASENEYGERHEYDNSEYHSNYPGKFYGTVEEIPGKGKGGVWIINGREVHVTNSTEIEEEHGKVAVGAYVEVEGDYSGKTFFAYEIEVKGESSSDDHSPQSEKMYNIKFSGIIETIPETEYDGLWIIDGRKVQVNSKTLIDETEGQASVGAYTEVKGIRIGDTITAFEIEIESDKE